MGVLFKSPSRPEELPEEFHEKARRAGFLIRNDGFGGYNLLDRATGHLAAASLSHYDLSIACAAW
jgi:hypothetical protein